MSQTKADADNLVVRIKFEALVSERDGMTAGKLTRDEADAKVRGIVEAWEREQRGKVKRGGGV